MKDTFATKLLQYVRDHPGVLGPDIHKHFRPEVPTSTISTTLGRLRRTGLITNNGSNGPRTAWEPVIFETPSPEFLELARVILLDLKNFPKSERENRLAQGLQSLCIQTKSVAESRKGSQECSTASIFCLS